MTGLKIITLRLREKDIATARMIAAERGIPYQHVIRAWVAEQAGRRSAVGVEPKARRAARAS